MTTAGDCPPAPHRDRGRITGIVGAALVAILLLGGCYTGPGADHFEAAFDELSIPESWSLVKDRNAGPDEDVTCDPFFSTGCPHALRAYLTGGNADTAFDQARDIVTRAGFDIEDGAVQDCSGLTATGLSCYLFAHRGDVDLYVTVFPSASKAGLEDNQPSVVPVVFQATSN